MLNAVDGGGQTPLRYAAMAGHADCISALIQHGSEPDSVDDKGLAAAHYAAQKNHAPALRALIRDGADPLLPKFPVHNWPHPLFYACRDGQTEALEALRKSVKAQDLRKGALHWAAEAGEPEVLRALLEDPGVRIGIDDWDSNRNTPLYRATYAHRPAALKVLLDDGADVHATSEDRRPCREESLSSKTRRQHSGTKYSYAPIHGWARLSTAYSDLNLEEILTKHEKLFDYWWMQDVMSMKKTIEGAQHCLCMILLISAGVNIDAKRRTDGRTALMILSPWMENKMGATALDTAAMWNRREILAMFSREDELARSPSTSESGT